MSYSIEPQDPFFQVISNFPAFEIEVPPSIRYTALVDLTQVEQLRALSQEKLGYRISYTALVMRALGIALKEYPYANRRFFHWPLLSFLGPRLQRFHTCDVSVAVAKDSPGRESVAFFDVLRNTDQKKLPEITQWLKALGRCDETNNPQWAMFSKIIKNYPGWLAIFILRFPYWFPSLWVKYRGAAAMVNSSKNGVEVMAGTWVYPLTAVFGFVKERPMVKDGQVVARPSFHLLMTFDRRVMAGAPAGKVYMRLVQLLENAMTEFQNDLKP